MKINIKSSLPEIWIKVRFLNVSGSPSLVITILSSNRRNPPPAITILVEKLLSVDEFGVYEMYIRYNLYLLY